MFGEPEEIIKIIAKAELFSKGILYINSISQQQHIKYKLRTTITNCYEAAICLFSKAVSSCVCSELLDVTTKSAVQMQGWVWEFLTGRENQSWETFFSGLMGGKQVMGALLGDGKSGGGGGNAEQGLRIILCPLLSSVQQD